MQNPEKINLVEQTPDKTTSEGLAQKVIDTEKHTDRVENKETAKNEGGFFSKLKNMFGDKPVAESEAMAIINGHSAKRGIYEDLLSTEDKSPEQIAIDKVKAEKYVQFHMKNPKVKYVSWNGEKMTWEDRASYAVASGETAKY